MRHATSNDPPLKYHYSDALLAAVPSSPNLKHPRDWAPFSHPRDITTEGIKPSIVSALMDQRNVGLITRLAILGARVLLRLVARG